MPMNCPTVAVGLVEAATSLRVLSIFELPRTGDRPQQLIGGAVTGDLEPETEISGLS